MAIMTNHWKGSKQRQRVAFFCGVFVFFYIWLYSPFSIQRTHRRSISIPDLLLTVKTALEWGALPQNFPLDSILLLPLDEPVSMPRIQHVFGSESVEARNERRQRLSHVKEEFIHAWSGYQRLAMPHDELKGVSGDYQDPFGGWGATMIDALGSSTPRYCKPR